LAKNPKVLYEKDLENTLTAEEQQIILNNSFASLVILEHEKQLLALYKMLCAKSFKRFLNEKFSCKMLLLGEGPEIENF
jgi:hypothetical protein